MIHAIFIVFFTLLSCYHAYKAVTSKHREDDIYHSLHMYGMALTSLTNVIIGIMR